MTDATSRAPWPGDRDQLLRMAGERARFGGLVHRPRDRPRDLDRMSSTRCSGIRPGSRTGTPSIGIRNTTERSVLDSISKFDGTPFDHRRDFPLPGGEVVRIRTMGEAHRDESGKIVGVQGAFFDIGALLAAEEARGTVERTLGEALNRITDGIIMFDADWIFTYLNPGCRRES